MADDFPSLQSLLIPAIVFSVIAYLYFGVTLSIIARKTATPGEWMAWVPPLNLILMCQVGRCSFVWLVLLFIPCLNVIAAAVIWSAIAKARGKPGWFGILVFVPVINIFLPAILASGQATAVSPTSAPRACASCGVPAQGFDAFCGNCGAALPAAVVAPAASGGAGGCCLGVVGIMFLLLLGCGGAGAYFWSYSDSYTPIQRQEPGLPPRIAGTMRQLPLDQTSVPTAVVIQEFPQGKNGQSDTKVQVPANQLPPGLKPEDLPGLATAVVSAPYRDPTRPSSPPTYVHVIETSANPRAGEEIVTNVGRAVPGELSRLSYSSPGGDNYEVNRFQGSTVVVYIMICIARDLVVIVYAPDLSVVEDANRLANRVGNGAGLYDPQFRNWVWVLPTLPPGIRLAEMRVITRSEVELAKQDGQSQMTADESAEFAKVMTAIEPLLFERLTLARYVDEQDRDWFVAVADYESTAAARRLWWLFSLISQAEASGSQQVKGVKGRYFFDVDESGQDQVILAFRKGPYLVFLLAPRDVGPAGLAALGESLQL